MDPHMGPFKIYFVYKKNRRAAPTWSAAASGFIEQIYNPFHGTSPYKYSICQNTASDTSKFILLLIRSIYSDIPAFPDHPAGRYGAVPAPLK